MTKKRILVLYAEVMGYVIEAFNKYQKLYEDTEILIIELDNKKLTKFKFTIEDITYKAKSTFHNTTHFFDYCIDFKPDLVLVSGRKMDSDYLKITKKFKNEGIYTVTLQDTQFEFTFRQFIISKLSYFLYKKNFNAFWGSGELQTSFGLRLGYNIDKIYSGFYTADTDLYKYAYSTKTTECLNFLFVGRLVSEKNILIFAKVIEEINLKFSKNHKLIIVGDGYLRDKLAQYACTEIHDFMMPKDLLNIAKKSDVFCLPSKYEPWGVVLHEFCCLGFPILVSDKCGANRTFVIDNYNGYVFDPNSYTSIYNVVLKFINLNIDQRFQMSNNSKVLSQRNNLEIWAANLRMILSDALNKSE